MSDFGDPRWHCFIRNDTMEILTNRLKMFIKSQVLIWILNVDNLVNKTGEVNV